MMVDTGTLLSLYDILFKGNLLLVTSSIITTIWIYFTMRSGRPNLHPCSLYGTGIIQSSKNLIANVTVFHKGCSSQNFTSLLTPGSSSTTTITTSTLSNTPLLSVIVPARNEWENIERCVLSLIAQDYTNFEVIVIDDNSTDMTTEIVKNIINTHYTKDASPEVKEYENGNDRLKIIQLTSKPPNWTGKTWACQQGYLQSKGSILLFTDADACFKDKSTISSAISYMQQENIDVMTGDPRIELRDFLSKISMPIWNHFSILIGADTDALNDGIHDGNTDSVSKSDVAFVRGPFFVIRRNALERIRGFESVKQAMPEDVELGRKIKKSGYPIRLVKVDEMVTALWSRDTGTLWHGIKRSLAPMKTERVIYHFMILLFMMGFPFLTLFYSFSEIVIMQYHTIPEVNWSLPHKYTYYLLHYNMQAHFSFSDLGLNPVNLITICLDALSCIAIVAGTAIEDINRHKISRLYSLLAPIGIIFLIVCYSLAVVRLLVPFSNRKLLFIWRDREYSSAKIGI